MIAGEEGRTLNWIDLIWFGFAGARLVNQAPGPIRWFVLDAEAMVDIDTSVAGHKGKENEHEPDEPEGECVGPHFSNVR